jgi:hypothetical protein
MSNSNSPKFSYSQQPMQPAASQGFGFSAHPYFIKPSKKAEAAKNPPPLPPLSSFLPIPWGNVSVIGLPENSQSDAAKEFLQLVRISKRRQQLRYGFHRVDLSRLPYGQLFVLIESIEALFSLPQVRSLFCRPLGGIVYEPSSYASFSKNGKSQALLACSTSARAYLAVAIEEGHLIYGLQKGCIGWSELSYNLLMSSLRSLISKLSGLHAAGLEAGDTSCSNILIAKDGQAYLISPAHLSVLEKSSMGIPEVLVLISQFSNDLKPEDVKELIRTYLSGEGARERAESYLRNYCLASRRMRFRHYSLNSPLEERLYSRLEDFVDPLPLP